MTELQQMAIEIVDAKTNDVLRTAARGSRKDKSTKQLQALLYLKSLVYVDIKRSKDNDK